MAGRVRPGHGLPQAATAHHTHPNKNTSRSRKARIESIQHGASNTSVCMVVQAQTEVDRSGRDLRDKYAEGQTPLGRVMDIIAHYHGEMERAR